MQTPDENNGHVETIVVPTMTIIVDPQTMAVSYKCTKAPIYFWQMCVGEVVKQLEEQRRTAAALNLQEQLREQARVQALADSAMRKR